MNKNRYETNMQYYWRDKGGKKKVFAPGKGYVVNTVPTFSKYPEYHGVAEIYAILSKLSELNIDCRIED